MKSAAFKKSRKKIHQFVLHGKELQKVDQMLRDLHLAEKIFALMLIYSTGTLEQLSKKLRVKENRVMRVLISMIDVMKMPVEYSASLKTYYFAAAKYKRTN